ncbi:molecular mechanism For the regulation of protein kinase B Akt By hydrophobic motif phosphorylation [Polychytrium aggregatum]|uniref:molecular mechanism For the regulation of protein kinase B Akt By hydrophobic motif phosphorylation n=1 Tax=Polychytrium aggregatum TaxID=110093 RepID=UPI0022FDF78E|nr:molecular mechanism For the regulation of protein kinase B Akt By hydrophobic motif phosphorylation [Polychytrium aggregatum]KAI9203541.1 molecular mechanism For the regulation of protein kinase B Akt By hydrophobic motif phosphorylation [Polychytrium aggregatum]
MSINDFEIHKVIGRGKFAKVLLCIQKSTGTAYAIKVLHKTAEDQCDPQTESNILRSIVHPFIVGLHYAFQSPERLYLVMEYVNGGELYFHICNFGRFSEDRVRFYAAEIFLAIECLHGKGIAYRDLKLENILLAKDGHVKITDFGLSKQEEESDDSSTVSLVGTLEYLAPEVICGLENSFGADWWAFGVVIFEMLCGYHPFYSDDREQIRYNILHSVVEYPDHCSPESKDIISRFLQRNPSLRLGASAADGLEIRSHPFFSSIDFTKLFNKEILPPFRPELDNDLDVRFFDEMFTEEPTVLTPTESAADLGGNEVAGFSFHGKG